MNNTIELDMEEEAGTAAGPAPLTPEQQKLFDSAVNLVYYLAARLLRGLPKCIDRKEAVQDGFIGLTKAARAYKPDRGVRFGTFAGLCIQRLIRQGVRHRDWVPFDVRASGEAIPRLLSINARRRGMHGRGSTLAERLPGRGSADLSSRMCAGEVREILDRLKLPQDRRIAQMRFVRGMKYDEIGAALGLKRGQVWYRVECIVREVAAAMELGGDE